MTIYTGLTIDLENWHRLVFGYDAQYDIAMVHLNAPRPADTDDVEDGWYVRLDGEEIVGLELHGLRRGILTSPFFTRAFAPAMRELSETTHGSLNEDFRIDAAVEEIPATTRFVILLLGVAAAKLEQVRRADARAAVGLRAY